MLLGANDSLRWAWRGEPTTARPWSSDFRELRDGDGDLPRSGNRNVAVVYQGSCSASRTLIAVHRRHSVRARSFEKHSIKVTV
jgi:hypothetical protein